MSVLNLWCFNICDQWSLTTLISIHLTNWHDKNSYAKTCLALFSSITFLVNTILSSIIITLKKTALCGHWWPKWPNGGIKQSINLIKVINRGIEQHHFCFNHLAIEYIKESNNWSEWSRRGQPNHSYNESGTTGIG